MKTTGKEGKKREEKEKENGERVEKEKESGERVFDRSLSSLSF
jgi:hypothetical protein